MGLLRAGQLEGGLLCSWVEGAGGGGLAGVCDKGEMKKEV